MRCCLFHSIYFRLVQECENLHSLSEYKISAADRYTSFLLPILLIIVDYIVIVSAEQLAFVIRNFVIPNGGTLHISWFSFWIVFPLLYLIFINIEQLYSRRMQFWKLIEKLFYASIYAIVSIILFLYVGQIAASTSRLFIILFGIISFLFLIFSRYIVKKIFERFGVLQIPILIIGAGKTAEILAKCILDDVGMGYKVIGLLEDNNVEDGILKKFPVLGGFADAESVIKKTGVQNLLIAAPGLEQVTLVKLIDAVQPLVKSVGVVPNLVGVPMSGVEIESLLNEKIMILYLKNNLVKPVNKLLKIFFEIILTVISIVIFSPVLCIIALLIYLDSKGPIIYDGKRVGQGEKEFKCYKFRSMYVNGEEILANYLQNNNDKLQEWQIFHKLNDDPRVTLVGKFLRKTSLDELPQIFNVLMGHMSLVGPRPYLKNEIKEMGEAKNIILLAKPGITGYWQVNGRSDVSFEERVKMDCWYVKNWSLWIDLLIIFKTIKVVINKTGAK